MSEQQSGQQASDAGGEALPDINAEEIELALTVGKQLALATLRSGYWQGMSLQRGEGERHAAMRAAYLTMLALSHGASAAILACTLARDREGQWKSNQIAFRTTYDIAFDDTLRAMEKAAAMEQAAAAGVEQAVERAIAAATVAAQEGKGEGA